MVTFRAAPVAGRLPTSLATDTMMEGAVMSTQKEMEGSKRGGLREKVWVANIFYRISSRGWWTHMASG